MMSAQEGLIMDTPLNWIEERLWVLYQDASSYDDILETAKTPDTPETTLILAEERDLVLRMAVECLNPPQAAAIEALLTGEADSQAAAAHAAGITQVQLHRTIKWLKRKYTAYYV